MKKSKMLHRIAAALLAGTMMMAMGTTAFADEPQGTTVTLTKTITADENVLAPETSFGFTISNGVEQTIKAEDGTNIVVYAGVNGNATFADGQSTTTLAFTPGEPLTKSTDISFETDYDRPGVYHYVVSEDSGDYDGMSYSTERYDVYVFVENDTNGYKIAKVLVYNENGAKEENVEFDNIYATNNVSLKKVVDGNQADKSKKFDFTVTVNGQSGEKYTAILGSTTTILETGVPVKFTLGNDETVTIYGLSENDAYEFVETDYSADGYKTTITGADTTDGLTATGNTKEGNDAVVYTNRKDVQAPTGIMMNVAPYVLMVAVAAVLAVVFLRRKNNFEN